VKISWVDVVELLLNPDHPAETKQPSIARPRARTPHAAAPSRARSALMTGSALPPWSAAAAACHSGVCTVNVSVSRTDATSTGGMTPICSNSRSFSIVHERLRAQQADRGPGRVHRAWRTSINVA